MNSVSSSFTAELKAAIDAERRSALRFQILLEQIPIPLCHVNFEERFVFINDYFQQTFGYTLEDIQTLDMWWQRAYPDPVYRASVLATWNEAVQEASATGKMIRPVCYKVTHKSGDIRHVVISGITLGDDFLATFTDVTETQEQQQLLGFSNQILQQISQGEGLPHVLETICQAIEEVNPGIRCSLLLIDEDGRRLRHGAAPSLPVAYANAIDGVAIGPCVGSCGTAVYRKEAVFVADIQQDVLWANFKDLAALYDLAACWSSPVFSSAGEVIGTFGIYWSSPHPHVTELLKRYVETTTSVTSIAIENDLRKQRLEHQLQELQRWQRLTLDREDRILELKAEVNALLLRVGEAPRYDDVSTPHPHTEKTPTQAIAHTSRVLDASDHMRQVYLSMLEDQALAAAKLRQAASVFEHTHEGICITDKDGIILNVNRAFSQITGYEKSEVIGQKPSILKSDRHDAAFYQTMWQALIATGQWSSEIWNKSKTGRIFPEQLTISAVKDDAGHTTSYVGLFADISALKAQEQQLERMAHYDVLTHLPNRVLLADRLRQAMARTRRSDMMLAVVYLDLDGFKAVNDTYGHEAGDGLLSVLGVRMQQVLRIGDTLARIGGDEFVAVLIDLPTKEACLPVVERLLQAAAAPVVIDHHSLQVSASMGVSFFLPSEPHIEADQLLRQADQAMYQAKQSGRNRYHLCSP